MINVTGLWKNKSKTGTSYYKSPKLKQEARDKLIEALKSEEDIYFLIFNSTNKEEGSNKPDIDLVIGENQAKKE